MERYRKEAHDCTTAPFSSSRRPGLTGRARDQRGTAARRPFGSKASHDKKDAGNEGSRDRFFSGSRCVRHLCSVLALFHSAYTRSVSPRGEPGGDTTAQRVERSGLAPSPPPPLARSDVAIKSFLISHHYHRHHCHSPIMAASSAELPNLVSIDSPEHFTSTMSADLNRISLLNFWAPWAEPCTQMNQVVKELAVKYPKVLFLNVSAQRTR